MPNAGKHPDGTPLQGDMGWDGVEWDEMGTQVRDTVAYPRKKTEKIGIQVIPTTGLKVEQDSSTRDYTTYWNFFR